MLHNNRFNKHDFIENQAKLHFLTTDNFFDMLERSLSKKSIVHCDNRETNFCHHEQFCTCSKFAYFYRVARIVVTICNLWNIPFPPPNHTSVENPRVGMKTSHFV